MIIIIIIGSQISYQTNKINEYKKIFSPVNPFSNIMKI